MSLTRNDPLFLHKLYYNIKLTYCCFKNLFYRFQISDKLGILIKNVGIGSFGECSKNLGGCKCCCQEKLVVSQNYVLVDGGETAYVGPSMYPVPHCGCSSEKTMPSRRKQFHSNATEISTSEPQGGKSESKSKYIIPSVSAVVGEEKMPSCKSISCLNGGKCIPRPSGPVCICPYRTQGSRCKVLTRQFIPHDTDEYGKATDVWLESVPTCSYLHMSLYVITEQSHGLILYTGDSSDVSQFSFFALHITNGQPHFTLRQKNSRKITEIVVNTTIHDNKWHRLDLLWKNKVRISVDFTQKIQ